MTRKNVIVNVMVGNPSIKTVGSFFMYKTWDGTPWFAEIIENGNAFFHWQPGDRENGHRDTIMQYIAGDGTRWQTTIHNYTFMLSLEGDIKFSHYDTGITYLCLDNNVYRSSFAETYEE